MRLRRILFLLAMLVPLALHMPVAAQERPILLRDSFSIGNEEGIFCQVQDRSLENAARQSMFDRAWAVVCRDSARPVATVYAFRGDVTDPVTRIAPFRREPVDCSTGSAGVAALSGAATREICHIRGTELGWSIYRAQQGDVSFVAEGYSAYDSATELAMRSVLENRLQQGVIDVATTSVRDPFAFARIQAATLEPGQAMAEGYRRNLGGEYAEAAAYFETLEQRLSDDEEADINPGEFLVNRALQKSNLGEFAEADRLFIQAEPITADDPIAARLQRNFEAIHLLNQGYNAEAIERIDRPVTAGLPSAEAMAGRLEISQPIAARINRDSGGAGLLSFVDEVKLSELERAMILDAQALQLRGTALRLSGDTAGARTALLDAYDQATSVRDGRVTSIARLRSQILGELALVAESEGDLDAADSYLLNATDVLQAQYPDRRAVSGIKARRAAMLLRNGREAEGSAIYREVVDHAAGKGDAATGFLYHLAPYFRRLAPLVASDESAAEDFFKATQILVRPGVAETQTILARELSARNDDASRLFRQSTRLTREIERARIAYASSARQEQTASVRRSQADRLRRIDEMERQQQRTQAALANYPQYRVTSPRSLSLAEFRNSLLPGEAFARLAVVGDSQFMFYTDKEQALAWPVSLSPDDLDLKVDLLRASISVFEGGQYLTYPYDIEAGRELYTLLFAPVADRLRNVRHLVFEPDGAMLRLPVDLLVTDDASVDRYVQRLNAGGDPFDFTGVSWLGRDRMISTAVSAQSFVDARKSDRSAASREYLGLGMNAPIGDNPPPAIASTLLAGGNSCGWTSAEWNRPIDDAELRNARGVIGGNRSELITGSTFSDSAVMAKDDLNQYRVLHFATHGLVTAPRPSCPVRPALLTSFGGQGSDGLLSFQEIFDLDLDADIVILSACDTAGKASIQATREAGIGRGGGTALDGLVRAFIGAGGRSVLASHWPAPDEYNATARLMNEMFRLGRNRDVGDALSKSRKILMDEAQTSHPYYWAGFSIIGDAARPLLTEPPAIADADGEAGGGSSQARK